jgi:hypothetical protein
MISIGFGQNSFRAWAFKIELDLLVSFKIIEPDISITPIIDDPGVTYPTSPMIS